MLVGIMATNGGPHSPETEATATAGQIIQIGENVSGERATSARKLELSIIDALEASHGAVKASERAKIAEVGPARLSAPLDPTEHVDPAVKAVVAAAQGTPYGDHFAKPEVKDYIRNVLGQHFATSMWNERDWHAKGFVVGDDHKAVVNPKHDAGNAHVKAWMARHHSAAA